MNFPVLCISVFGLLTAFLAGFAPGGRKDPAVHGTTDQMHYRIMFYNTENLFDTRNDSVTADDEFTPQGDMHWNNNRYTAKLNNLYKTIIALGGWQPPDIIGVCEIENCVVLSDLLNLTPLSKFPYRIIHDDSPDRRGIDVALLYNSETVRFLQSKYFNINKPGLFTREILYFKALIHRDTCHFLINHWPSRSAGQLRTETDRLSAALRLRSIVDSLFQARPNAKIIITGDFNDEPQDESLSVCLSAGTDPGEAHSAVLYNLSIAPASGKFRGTVKFRGQWNLFDQVIVSGTLLQTKPGLWVLPSGYRIFGPSFLLTEDDQYNGFKPFRTYNGYNYQGGFSDHLPVYIDLYAGK